MDYKVLYRKYRPLIFNDITGQSHIVEILKKEIINNKISHAYLLTGPRGTGKTTTAKVFARSINCTNLKEGNPCLECSACLSFEENPDIIEIDAASNNGVDEIRELRDNARLVPTALKYKIYIIDEVHMLSTGAFNALLKILEEPPKHVIFILATTEFHKIPITVVSRCQRFDFNKISVNNIALRLREICDKENILIEENALKEIAFMSDGALRDALGMLDQISSSFDQTITSDDVVNMFKTTSNQIYENLFSSLEKNDIKEISKIVNDLEISGQDFNLFVNKFINILRKNAVSVKQNSKKSQLSFTKIKNLIFSLNRLLLESKTSINPFLLLEVELLDFLEDNVNSNLEGIEISKNEDIETKELEKKIIDNSNDQKTEDFEESSEHPKIDQEIFVNNCFVEANKDSLQKCKNNWQKLLEEMEEKNKKIYSLIVDTQIVAASENYLIIVATNDSQAVLLNNNIVTVINEYDNIFAKKYKMLALNDELWQENKKTYITNIKNGVKYNYMEEKNIINNEVQNEEEIYDIFAKEKVEVN